MRAAALRARESGSVAHERTEATTSYIDIPCENRAFRELSRVDARIDGVVATPTRVRLSRPWETGRPVRLGSRVAADIVEK
jgi:hypothetical protein